MFFVCLLTYMFVSIHRDLIHASATLFVFLQQKMKMGPLVARVLKLFLHFHLVFSTGITFNYLIKVE